ncbi:AraC family transcriptional regulator [Flavobacterium sp. K5-23]|uniref:helix-turn-helix domain-containing protein n=1 Tax=Flavobacterium sp. K5-23 TaxID=2746225 RepID=UPI00200F4C63|nr:AraC family transcriptional regulator [Flavobacterium sp. K5-23]UQD55150.1 helix-turn-helix transcriptional regulator [Flavobacterium sp. K5-23]
MKLYIKNMVCSRCEMAVKAELEKIGHPVVSMTLGEVEVSGDIEKSEMQLLTNNLNLLGFELLDDKVSKIIERIKNLIVDLVHYKTEKLKTNLSNYLAEDLQQDYNSLSNLFSEMEGITIEHYFIAQKIERAKELLIYNELTLSEIAFQLNYSNVAHLSNQFKKTTGFTPTHFKKLKDKKRIQIDDL